MLDLINRKISGLCTLVIESSCYEQAFTKRHMNVADIYRIDYPEGTRVLLIKFEQYDFEELEADIVEFFFDVLISERYKEWNNYDLVQKNIEWLKENFLK